MVVGRPAANAFDFVSDSPVESPGDPNRGLRLAAAIAGATAIFLGAFGAHWLPNLLEPMSLDPPTLADRVEIYDVAARYHLTHAVVLLAMMALPPSRRRTIACGLMIAGICLFSGSLYLLVLTNTPVLGAITPVGGLAWILGWITLAFCSGPLRTTT